MINQKKWNTKTWFSPSESFKISLYSYSPRCKKKTPARYVSFIYFYLPTVQYSTVQYCTVQYSTVQYCTVQYCTVLYSTVLYCTVQYCTVQYCTVLYCTVLYSTVLYCTVLYCTVLYCWEIEVNEANVSGGGFFFTAWWITIEGYFEWLAWWKSSFGVSFFLINHDDSSSRRTKLPW